MFSLKGKDADKGVNEWKRMKEIELIFGEDCENFAHVVDAVRLNVSQLKNVPKLSLNEIDSLM